MCFASAPSPRLRLLVVSSRLQLFPLANIPRCIRRRPLTVLDAAARQPVEIVSVSVDGVRPPRTGRTPRHRAGDELRCWRWRWRLYNAFDCDYWTRTHSGIAIAVYNHRPSKRSYNRHSLTARQIELVCVCVFRKKCLFSCTAPGNVIQSE